jgi:methionyl-tRNA formyltransferase
VKKIFCLIRKNPAQIYFVNKINENHKISLVIIESPVARVRLINKIASKGMIGSFQDIMHRLLNVNKRRKRLIGDYNKYFQDKWSLLNKSMSVLTTNDINSTDVYKLLSKEKPDLILDHGTSLVKNHIIENASLALNLHWGLSPYYRGSYCTEWALLNWDPYNIGVTIHKLAKSIDGGDILAQKRAVITPQDSVNSINMQLTKLGVELIIQVIDIWEKGEEPKFKKQDYSLGIMTCVKQWDRCLRKQVQKIENGELIKAMLERPARKQKLPIIEYEY